MDVQVSDGVGCGAGTTVPARAGDLRVGYCIVLVPSVPEATVLVALTMPVIVNCSRATKPFCPPAGARAATRPADCTVTLHPSRSVAPPWPQPKASQSPPPTSTVLVI